MGMFVGLDLGSTAIKAVFADKGGMTWRGVRATAPGQESAAKDLMDQGFAALGLSRKDISGVAVTGYGRKLFSSADRYVDEISANTAGAFRLSDGEARIVVNVGGQDLKVLFLDAAGRVTDFKMNDKCAAGTGRFFELVSRLLDTPISDFDRTSLNAKSGVEINSTCVVFAESEIVSLMARGTERGDIVKALFTSVAKRISGLVGLAQTEAVYLDGGPAQNHGLVLALEEELMTEVHILNAPQFTVAYGAALSLLN